MRALVFDEFGSRDVLRVRSAPDPTRARARSRLG